MRLEYTTLAISFNPCFNGTMYKNVPIGRPELATTLVSILVLMELCIKTDFAVTGTAISTGFNPCFNGTMYKNHLKNLWETGTDGLFQSLF